MRDKDARRLLRLSMGKKSGGGRKKKAAKIIPTSDPKAKTLDSKPPTEYIQ